MSVFRGWLIVAGAFTVLFTAYGTQYSFGVFFSALLDALRRGGRARPPRAVRSHLAFGYSYGAISTLFPAVVGDFFGRAHAGAIVGFLFAVAGSMAARFSF